MCMCKFVFQMASCLKWCRHLSGWLGLCSPSELHLNIALYFGVVLSWGHACECVRDVDGVLGLPDRDASIILARPGRAWRDGLTSTARVYTSETLKAYLQPLSRRVRALSVVMPSCSWHKAERAEIGQDGLEAWGARADAFSSLACTRRMLSRT